MFIFSSDWHITNVKPVCRIDNILESQFDKVKYIIDFAKEHKAEILQAGDMFESPRSWMLLKRVYDLLCLYSEHIHCIYGQHDLYMRSLSSLNNYEALYKMRCFHDLSCGPVIWHGYAIHGSSYGQCIPEPVEKKNNILVIHRMIYNTKMYETQTDGSNALEFLKKYKEYDIILCGDAHQKFCIEHDGRYILNTGPLIRDTVDLFNHQPGFFILDQGNISWQDIPCKPADQVMDRNHIDIKKERSESVKLFIELIKNKNIKSMAFEDKLKEAMDNNLIEDEVISIIVDLMEELNDK